MRVKTMALMMTGAFFLPLSTTLSIAAAPPVQAQALPRQLPDAPLPELPSVSDYSLPPGNDQEPANNNAQGPVEENSLPPKSTSNPDDIQSGAQPVVRPVPVTPTPRTTSNSADGQRSQPAQNQTQAVDDGAGNTPPDITASPPQSIPSMDNGQPQPDATTTLPAPAASIDQSVVGDAPETPHPTASQTNGSGKNDLYYFGGSLALLLLAGLGLYFRRRRTTASLSEKKIVDDPAPSRASEPRKPAPKIYSPPNPAETRKSPPTLPGRAPSGGVSSDGFVTSKIGVFPTRQPASKSIPTVTPSPPQASIPRPTHSADSTLADHLQIEFIANGASSTLLNAVLNYTVTLTNISEQDLSDIRLSGAMMQADTENALNGATQSGDLLHITETLSAGDMVTLTGEIRTPLYAIRPITFKLQTLFIPLAHFDVTYKDDKGSEHHQRSSFIIGREYEPPRTKMAPFRLDQGPRRFGPVGQRPLITR